jgi:hypothetical protein
MNKAKPPHSSSVTSASGKKPAEATTTRESLFVLRMRELDREFARQTKQLTALTKKLSKKLSQPIHLSGKSTKHRH